LTIKSINIKVVGRVQGVGFRYFAYEYAKQLNICGYVKNLSNGDVEILAIAEAHILPIYLNILQQGSPRSDILSLDYEEIKLNKEYNDFKIIY
jgi:acylphosphatase